MKKHSALFGSAALTWAVMLLFSTLGATFIAQSSNGTVENNGTVTIRVNANVSSYGIDNGNVHFQFDLT